MSDSFNGFGVYSLERHRLVLPKGIESYLPWLVLGENSTCLGLPGHAGGLAVFSPEELLEHQRTRLALEGAALAPIQMPSEVYQLARSAAVFWEVSIGPDRRLTLPKGARELGIVPAEPDDQVAVVAFRGVIEIWTVAELRAQIRESAAHWGRLKATLPEG